LNEFCEPAGIAIDRVGPSLNVVDILVGNLNELTAAARLLNRHPGAIRIDSESQFNAISGSNPLGRVFLSALDVGC
jgi:hypothetical protein